MRTYSRRGFTLIELSIVLVIIGLLVSGVLAGKDLIHAAELRAQVTEIGAYNAAVHAFELKFGGLPGDLQSDSAARLGFAARAGTAGQGDGDGLIEDGAANSNGGWWGWPAGETVLFWNDLSRAGLISGSYQGVDCTLFGNSCAGPGLPTGQIVPPLKVSGGSFMVVTNDKHRNYYQTQDMDPVSGIWATGQPYSSTQNNYSISPSDSYELDSKMDDGYPTSGNVTAWPIVSQFGPASAANCGSTDSTPPVYNTSPAYGNQLLCAIQIAFQ